MTKRQRRSFSAEFKAEAVRLCRVGDRSVKQVAGDLDLTETALRDWVKRSDIDAGQGPPGALTTAEREELTRLRRENKRLQMEREILKKAAADSTARRNGVVVERQTQWANSGLGGSPRSRRAISGGVGRRDNRSATSLAHWERIPVPFTGTCPRVAGLLQQHGVATAGR